MVSRFQSRPLKKSSVKDAALGTGATPPKHNPIFSTLNPNFEGSNFTLKPEVTIEISSSLRLACL